jgi:hypothetical protein
MVPDVGGGTLQQIYSIDECPHSPTGRGNRLKICKVSVQIRLRVPKFRVYSTTVSMSAFQAHDVGSIPTRRSILPLTILNSHDYSLVIYLNSHDYSKWVDNRVYNYLLNFIGLVAQLDSARDFYSLGWGFDSLRGHHTNALVTQRKSICLRNRRSGVRISPSAP